MENSFFNYEQFMPHGMCYLWKADILWTSVISDVLTAVAYYSITIAVIVFVKKRADLPYPWFFILVGSVIFLACGTSHLIAAIVIWKPIYGISAIVKAITAISSVASGILIWYFLPFFLSIQSPKMLELQVKRRTEELAKSNKSLNEEILHHKQSCELVEQLESYKRNIIDSMPSILIGVDKVGNITQWNSAAQTVTGKSADEVKGIPLSAAFPRLANEMEKITETIKLQKQHNDFRRSFSIGGNTFYEDLIIYPLIGEGSEGAVIKLDDVTSKVSMEEQVRRTQKMDALGKLTGGIAHDYNNMLNVILGYTEMLQGKLTDNPTLLRYTDHIYRSGERGVNLTKKLLSFSRKSATEESPLNLNDFLKAQYDMLQKVLTVQILLRTDLFDDVWLVWLDKNELEDTLLNMCINSMHAMSEEQSDANITIQTCNQTLNQLDVDALGLEKPGDYVQLSLIDNGCGMDRETKEKIFDPFFTSKGDQGTGLGLFQVFNFVKRAEGIIKVYSEVGHGSKFALYFPRHEEGYEVKTQEPLDNVTSITGSEAILIVDDEPAMCELTSEILTQQGYTTFTAQSGEEALTILKDRPIDLVLSDVIMPDMDGYQLVEAVKKLYPEIKIQLASGFSDVRHQNLVDETIHKNLLNKPFDSKTLLIKIRALLNG